CSGGARARKSGSVSTHAPYLSSLDGPLRPDTQAEVGATEVPAPSQHTKSLRVGCPPRYIDGISTRRSDLDRAILPQCGIYPIPRSLRPNSSAERVSAVLGWRRRRCMAR